MRALVREQGVQISMDAVAARAGCSKQTLYAHYGSKQALLLQVLNDDARNKASRLVTAQASQFPDDVRSLFEPVIAGLQRRVAAWLQQAMRRGLLRHDDPQFAAELLLGMIVGMDFDRQRFLVPHRDSTQAQAQWAEFAVDSFLRAFAPAPPRS